MILQLVIGIRGSVDILMISERKIDSRFPESKFLINGCSEPFRIRQNSQGGEGMLHVKSVHKSHVPPSPLNVPVTF